MRKLCTPMSTSLTSPHPNCPNSFHSCPCLCQALCRPGWHTKESWTSTMNGLQTPSPRQVIACQALRGGDPAYSLPAILWWRRQAASLHAHQAGARPSKQLSQSCTRGANMRQGPVPLSPLLCNLVQTQLLQRCTDMPSLQQAPHSGPGKAAAAPPQLLRRLPTLQSPGLCSETCKGAPENTEGQARTDSLTNSPKRAASRPRGITCRRSPI